METWKLISATKLSTCEVCKKEFPIGTQIYWRRSRMRCLEDHNSGEVLTIIGKPGQSAQKMFELKSNARTERILRENPRIGPTLLKLFKAGPQISNWEKGAVGERKIGESLNQLAKDENYIVLHDRRISGTKKNIDHILIATHGIFVVDSKNYEGKIRVKENTNVRQKQKTSLYINDKNQDILVGKLKDQVDHVKSLLESANFSAPVIGILAFYYGDLGILNRPQFVDGVLINGKGVIKGITENITGFKISVSQAAKILETSLAER